MTVSLTELLHDCFFDCHMTVSLAEPLHDCFFG